MEYVTGNNVSSFAIEYSTNGVDFSPIGTVAANGTTNDVSEYSFIHLNPNVQKQISTELSKLILIINQPYL
ncbi:MAG: hypothetical protein IPI78_11400 [Chitinophagaceae bacterium]|nr:hypothetical protein [Chitinophagaceae bacterium]